MRAGYIWTIIVIDISELQGASRGRLKSLEEMGRFIGQSISLLAIKIFN